MTDQPAGRTTVVIPCYKDDRFLDEALDSVVKQTIPVARIVVVDDGSPTALKERHYDGVDLVWVRTENRGLGAARNEGLRHATGEFVAFLDADDHWHPEKLEKQEALLDEHLESVAAYTQCIDQPGYYPFGPYPDPFLSREKLAAIVWGAQFFPPSSLLVRLEVCSQLGGFREGLSNGEDLDFLFRLFKYGEVSGVSEPLTYYRVHDNQITSSSVRKILGAKESRRGIIEHSGELLVQGGIPRSSFWGSYRNSILGVFYRRDFKSSRVMLFDYWKDHPTDFKVLIYFMISLMPAGLVTALRGKV